MYNLKSFFCFFALTVLSVQGGKAQESSSANVDTARIFKLGEVVIMGDRPIKNNSIGLLQIRSLEARRVPEAVSWLPGVTLTEASSRGETQLFLRGFDQTRIPIFMDGIPIYVPYDGYIDLGRILTSSIAKIEVNKGASSLLLGGNTMGGAVNIISSRPTDRFEAEVQASTLWNGSVSLGTKQKYWYARVDAGWIGRNDFRLPSGFQPVEGLQEDYTRHHSQTQDWQFGAKLGITPNATDEYAIGYNLIRADKYVPPYLGTEGKPRFWRYKDWDKDQLFLRARTRLADNWQLDGRAYYDRYYNLLKAYDDNQYNSQEGNQAFDSYYDDYSLGAGLSLQWKPVQTHQLTLGGNLKNDVHRSHDDDDPQARQSESTISVALEDNWSVNDHWTLAAGVGYFAHQGHTVELYEQLEGTKEMGLVNYPVSTDHDFNYQLSADWRPATHQAFRFSFARNSRFASLKDRYSYKRGKALPNPNLKTEHSYNFDLTYTGQAAGFGWYASAYYMILTNIIQEITGVDPDDPKIWQLQNRGRAHFRGIELGLNYQWRWVETEMNYTYINRRNCLTPEVKFLDVPENTFNARLKATPFWGIGIQATWQMRSKAWSSSDGSTYAPGFGVVNLSVGKTCSHIGCPDANLELRAGVNNLFDKLYSYSEGYPMEGRRFYLSAAYRFSIK